MSMLSLKSGRRAAVTLVELTLMLALGAIVVAIAIRAYYWSAENERVRQAISLIGITRDSIASRYGMQPNYQNLSNDMVVSAFPKSLVVPGSSNIRDPFGGHLIVGPDRVSSLGDSNYIALTNLTPNACNKLSRADMGRDAAFIKVGASGPVYKAMALPLSQEDQATVDGLCKSSERVSVSWQFAAAGNALTTTPTGPDCISTACITAAKLDILDEILAAYSGDPLYAQSVARNTLFLLADTQHYSWASTDPNAPMSDARSLLSDSLLFVTGHDFNFGTISPQDLSLAVAYLQYKAVPGRTGDPQAQAAMMAAITSAATVMYQEAASRGMPGF